MATSRKLCSAFIQRVITDCNVGHWFAMFHSGETSLKAEPRQGLSSDVDDKVIKLLMQNYPQQITRGISKDHNLPYADT